jgi:hypothetical protein
MQSGRLPLHTGSLRWLSVLSVLFLSGCATTLSEKNTYGFLAERNFIAARDNAIRMLNADSTDGLLEIRARVFSDAVLLSRFTGRQDYAEALYKRCLAEIRRTSDCEKAKGNLSYPLDPDAAVDSAKRLVAQWKSTGDMPGPPPPPDFPGRLNPRGFSHTASIATIEELQRTSNALAPSASFPSSQTSNQGRHPRPDDVMRPILTAQADAQFEKATQLAAALSTQLTPSHPLWGAAKYHQAIGQVIAGLPQQAGMTFDQCIEASDGAAKSMCRESKQDWLPRTSSEASQIAIRNAKLILARMNRPGDTTEAAAVNRSAQSGTQQRYPGLNSSNPGEHERALLQMEIDVEQEALDEAVENGQTFYIRHHQGELAKLRERASALGMATHGIGQTAPVPMGTDGTRRSMNVLQQQLNANQRQINSLTQGSPGSTGVQSRGSTNQPSSTQQRTSCAAVREAVCSMGDSECSRRRQQALATCTRP